MEDHRAVSEQIVHLARLALAGRPQDVQLHIRKMAKRLRDTLPEVAESLSGLLQESPTRSSPLRRAESQAAPVVPVDLDTRLQLVRVEDPVHLAIEPIYEGDVAEAFEEILTEHRRRDLLQARGLTPTRTVLFTGPPGVGKTLGARWIAHELGLPLLILDLSAVMSSFLGRTGNNVRHVLDYAKSTRCVLLLDEFDAIAKRRDDGSEVGELKRLVTVLLQEIDDWPPGGLLVAATNHADLLDPAVWRRFEREIAFGLPDTAALAQALRAFLGSEVSNETWISSLAIAMNGASFSDVERAAMRARRVAALSGEAVDQELENMLEVFVGSIDKKDRIAVATELVASGLLSQRTAHEITGVSRDTIRKRTKSGGGA